MRFLFKIRILSEIEISGWELFFYEDPALTLRTRSEKNRGKSVPIAIGSERRGKKESGPYYRKIRILFCAQVSSEFEPDLRFITANYIYTSIFRPYSEM